MRPNWTGWGIIGLFFLGGIGFWIAIPEIWLGQIWVAVSLGLVGLYVIMIRRANLDDEMKRVGVRGTARILEMEQTGTYVNNQPRVKLKLHIEAPGIVPFEDEKTWTVPQIALGNLSAGTLAVYLKPEAPQDYVVDWFGAMSSGSPITIENPEGGQVQLGANFEAGEAVMEALREHGIDTTTGNVDLRQLPAAREAVLRALREHGIDAAHQTAVSSPAIPIEDTGQPMERLTKLEQLRNAGLISESEYKSQRERILDEV